MKGKARNMKKYQLIFKDLQEKIANDTYPVGDYLPTEAQLCQLYSASRDTIRKALKLLNQAGMVESLQGQGTKVVQRQHIQFPVSELTSYQELVDKLGMVSRTKVLAVEKVIVDDKLALKTGFASKSIIWRVRRQRQLDGVAAVLDTDYLDTRIVPKMTTAIAQDSIYAYLENELGLDIAYAQKEITIDQVSDTDKLHLDLGADKHLVSVKSKVFLGNTRQFQFTESRHKLDKFKFVDFAKRHKKTG